MYVCKTAKNGNFYPRSPCGERPCPRCSRGTLPKDFYPRSPCGERRKYMRCVLPVLISIHALLAESDATWYTSAPWMAFLSTLSLRRATGLSRYVAIIRQIFLSTLSLRRATAILAPLHNPDIVFLSTLSLRRATSACQSAKNGITISIHALLAESDQYWATRARAAQLFLSTLSLRRATWGCRWHSLRNNDFYPRSPCGERPILGNPCAGCPAISIHALLAESDLHPAKYHPYLFHNFYPRSPCGERRL